MHSGAPHLARDAWRAPAFRGDVGLGRRTMSQSTFDIDINYVAQLAELLQRTGLSEIELERGDAKIRVVKQAPPPLETHTHVAMTPAASAVAAAPSHPEHAHAAVDPSHPGLVTSPMVGTAYRASDPESANFVEQGQEVQEGAQLLIIEAMKVMNSIRAPRAGRVTRIFVTNAVPVEYGEPLMLIE